MESRQQVEIGELQINSRTYNVSQFYEDGDDSILDSTEGVIKAKRSGVQNLKREGWSEDKCRAYLVKHAQFIPRNYNYSDGMRLLGPLLQYAFGDENGDVALGVVWEFIEIERDPPYPEALFQKWKFKHLHRHEDLMLPHVPHANTISLPVLATDRLREWRERQSIKIATAQKVDTTVTQSGGHGIPDRLPDHIPASAYKKLYPNWREDAIHISAGGQVATPYLPKQEVFHRMRWNEQHGRGGKLQSMRTLTVEDLVKEKDQINQEEIPTSSSLRRSLSRRLRNNLSRSKVVQDKGIQEDRNSVRLQLNEHLPYKIPNANFARKFGLIPPEQTLGGHQILEQKTACQKQIESDQDLWDKAWEAAKICRKETGLDASIVDTLFHEATAEYHRQPFTPSLFFDNWNDYDFGPDENGSPKTPEIEDTQQSIPISKPKSGIEHPSQDCGRNIDADHNLMEPESVSFDMEDSYRQSSDLPLRNFSRSSQPRTLRTDFIFDGSGDVFLTLPSTIFDPIQIHAVNSIEIIQPTTSLLSLFGFSDTVLDESSTYPAAHNLDSTAERNHDSSPGHARPLTCCSETPEVLPPLVDTPPFTPLTPTPHSSTCTGRQSQDAAEVTGPKALSFSPSSSKKSAIQFIGPAVYPDFSLETIEPAPNSREGRTIVDTVSTSLPLKLTISTEQHALCDVVSPVGPSISEIKRTSVATMDLETASIYQNDSTVEKACISKGAVAPGYSLNLSRASVDLTLPSALDFTKTASPIAHLRQPKSASLDSRASRKSYDGVASQFCQSETTLNLFIHNKSYMNNSTDKSVSRHCGASMDKDDEQSPTSHLRMSVQAPPPLRIVKQPGQSQLSQGGNKPYQPTGLGSARPPRSSSIKRRNNTDRHEVVHHHHEGIEHRAKSEVASIESAQSASSRYSGRTPHARFLENISATTPLGIPSQNLSCCLEPSTEILGNFVAIDINKTMANPFTGKERNDAAYNAPYGTGRTKVIPNPYEFEPGSPYDNLARQTTFTDFIVSQTDTLPSSRHKHVKNAYSGDNGMGTGRQNSSDVPVPILIGSRLHRSESSPNIVPGRFLEHRRRSPSPDLVDPYYYGAYDEPESPSVSAQRGRQSKNTSPYRDHQHRVPDAESASRSMRSHPADSRTQGSNSTSYRGRQQAELSAQAPSRKGVRNDAHDSDSRSHYSRHDGRDSGSLSGRNHQYFVETYAQVQGVLTNGDNKPSMSTHHRTNSPVKKPICTERKEESDDQYDSSMMEPKKRSRSPMKKMFGQGGWLANSPSEAENFRQQAAKKAAAEKKEESTVKTSVMGKIRSKLEEFAEKADMSPIRNTHSRSNKQSKLAILEVSIGPPEQARIYMEIELMIVHTANSYLMNQFRQGRIDIDSIKKTYDHWKSKGRPNVVEFMYDQATQRELIAVNQHNFRFHGERAGDGIRISSMLYNWKVVASHMAVRTFCNADTIILKLLFDIEQILELLGGAEGILLRLQNIRLAVNEKVHISRKKRERELADTSVNGRQASYNASHPSEDFSRREASEYLYGGLKPVPNFYAEK